MDADKSLKIIHALANGVDPHTGEEYSPDSPYLHPQTVRALYMAVEAMERSKERAKKTEDRKKGLPGNAGKAWEAEEEQRMLKTFDGGKSIKEIAEMHQRTESAILSRLIMHDKVKL
jgi:DNA-binding NarL/FixJ family response regulator